MRKFYFYFYSSIVFQLVLHHQLGVQLNHICQNVPVTTASDMAEQVLKFCDGRLSNQMWDQDYMVQDNRKQSIVSENKPLQLDAFMV